MSRNWQSVNDVDAKGNDHDPKETIQVDQDQSTNTTEQFTDATGKRFQQNIIDGSDNNLRASFN